MEKSLSLGRKTFPGQLIQKRHDMLDLEEAGERRPTWRWIPTMGLLFWKEVVEEFLATNHGEPMVREASVEVVGVAILVVVAEVTPVAIR